MRLMRKIKNTKDDKVEHDDWEENMVQRGGEGENNMAKFKEVQEKSEEEMAEIAKLKMGGFNSLSNLNKEKEENQPKSVDQLKKETRKRFKKMNKQDLESGFMFTDVTEVSRGNGLFKYQTLASAATLGRLWDEQILQYQGNLQRGYKLNSKSEEVDVFSSRHVRDILESALSQKLNGGVITLNILDTIPLDFDSEDKTLLISPEQKIQILDGQHRIRSFSAWNRMYQKSPSSCISPEEFFMPILIEHVSENNAKLIFSEYATKFLKISNSRSLFLDVDSNVNRIARNVMNNSQLQNKVEVVSNTVKKNSNKIITFSVLTKGISAFKPATSKECETVENFLCLYWDTLIELFSRIMGNVDPEVRQEERSKSFAIESMFMVAYHYLAKELINDVDWKNKLSRLTSGNFLSRSNELWIKNITRNEGKLINTSVTQSFVTSNLLGYVLDK